MFNNFKRIKHMVSDFLANIDAAIDKIVVAHGAATGADLSNLKTEVLAEVKTATDALHSELSDTQAQLAAAQTTAETLKTSLTIDEGADAALVARVSDLELALTHVVNHLSNDNPDDALAAANAGLTKPIEVAPVPNDAPASDATTEAAPSDDASAQATDA